MEAEKLSRKTTTHNPTSAKPEKTSLHSSAGENEQTAETPRNSFSRVVKYMQTAAFDSADVPVETATTLVADAEDHADWLKQRAIEDMAQDIKARILHWQQLDPESQQIAEQILNAALTRNAKTWQYLNKDEVAHTLAQKISETMYQKWLGGGQGIYLEGRGLAAQFFKSNALSVPSLLSTIQELKQVQEDLPLLERQPDQFVSP